MTPTLSWVYQPPALQQLNKKPSLLQGFITMAQFRSIVAEVDPNLTEEDLDGIIAEIDEDGSGTMDFDEFCEMMMTTSEDTE